MFLFPISFSMYCGGLVVTRPCLDKVVDDYGAIPNICLNNPEERGPFHAQELAQGPCPHREELGLVAQHPDLADDVARPGHPSKLQITITCKDYPIALRKQSFDE
jgi:hypothetical protein